MLDQHSCQNSMRSPRYRNALEEVVRMQTLAAQGRTNEIFGTNRVYRLWPLNPASPIWRSSTYKEDVIIRALNGERAREVAKLLFSIGIPRLPDGSAPTSPWSDVDAAACERIMLNEYLEQGPEAVLFPAKYDHEFGWMIKYGIC
ncbi:MULTISPECIES: hypothetical protein [Rhodomicrobium]|uniref:hypothetical protein n=1 Tax=Rhodomicrobium TaxID=1068 RepID=UPI000F73A8BF|nr:MULTISPECIES: hypothetical protein [Rhodomicrobium]